MGRLTTHKLIVSVDAVVGVELLATTLAGKNMATVLPNFVLARHLQRLESFVTDITGVNPLSLSIVLCPPILIPSSYNMISLTSLLLKADPRLEGDVADDKADPSVCLQPDICLAVFFRNGWLHGPSTCT